MKYKTSSNHFLRGTKRVMRKKKRYFNEYVNDREAMRFELRSV